MGALLSRINVHLSTRINNVETGSILPHHKCRNCGEICDPIKSPNECANAKFTRTGTGDQVLVMRPVVPNNKVSWAVSFDYHPIAFTSDKVKYSTKEYVDKDPTLDPSVEIRWNENDVLCDRRSYHGLYKIVGRLPRNPCGRTGITGRGYLGHFGPNHAADPIVTRWKRDANGKKIIHPQTNKSILQFVSIRRKDTGEMAIPGGMVEKKEKVTDTLRREFEEEALNFPGASELERHERLATIKDVFENGGIKIYCGYVDDPRNTDNSWMETTAYNFHDENNEHVGLLNVNAGSDAVAASWQDLSSEIRLFASHANFVREVANIHGAHW